MGSISADERGDFPRYQDVGVGKFSAGSSLCCRYLPFKFRFAFYPQLASQQVLSSYTTIITTTIAFFFVEAVCFSSSVKVRVSPLKLFQREPLGTAVKFH